MRRELREYERNSSERRQRIFELYTHARAIEFTALKAILPRVALGSHTWHLIQERLAGRSSVGIDLTMRAWFYEKSLIDCGPELCVFPGGAFHYPSNIILGTNVFINRGVLITAPAPVQIGDRALLGPHIVINSGNHRFSQRHVPIRDQGHSLAPIAIGADVWLGAHSCILPGVTIGNGAVVGAGSVVTRDVAAWVVVAGVPARVIGERGVEPGDSGG